MLKTAMEVRKSDLKVDAASRGCFRPSANLARGLDCWCPYSAAQDPA